MKMKKRHEHVTVYPHEILWRASQRSLDLVGVNEDAREHELSIQALLIGFLAFEGFVNFVGLQCHRDVWENEREFFAGGDYRGIEGKVAYLEDQFPDFELDKGAEPYQTFKRVKEIRDKLSHPKPHSYSKERIITGDEHIPFDFLTEWKKYENKTVVYSSLEKLKELAETLRSEVVKTTGEHHQGQLLHAAFDGPLGMGRGISRSI
jgi:hypothetical protein